MTGVEIGEQCEGHALCVVFAPTVFVMDDEAERAIVADVEITDELLPGVRQAVNSCPVQAIRLREDGE